jgi:hypothetical protein
MKRNFEPLSRRFPALETANAQRTEPAHRDALNLAI